MSELRELRSDILPFTYNKREDGGLLFEENCIGGGEWAYYSGCVLTEQIGPYPAGTSVDSITVDLKDWTITLWDDSNAFSNDDDYDGTDPMYATRIGIRAIKET